jgi:hypothetical protein
MVNMCDLHLQPDPYQDLDTGEVGVTYTIEMRRSPNITEAEVSRRLTTCYDLLFSLARRRRNESLGGDCESKSKDRASHRGPHCSELAEASAASIADGGDATVLEDAHNGVRDGPGRPIEHD